MCYHLTMQVLQKVQYFLSVVILTIVLGLIEGFMTKHFVTFFTYDPYIELCAVVICLVTVLPVSVYFLSSRLPYIGSHKDQKQGTAKKEDAKMSELWKSQSLLVAVVATYIQL